MKEPILSICLPTYNRSLLLENSLAALLPQITENGDAVELVISDNGSTDGTRQLLHRIAHRTNICVYFNGTNIGAARNFDLAVQRANGRFCWIVGDDDVVCRGAVSRIVEVLLVHPEIAFVFVNLYLEHLQTIDLGPGSPLTHSIEHNLPVNCRDRGSRQLTWNELIDPSISEVYLGAMMMCVFRRDAWLRGRIGVEFGEPFCSTLASVYPHAVIFGKEMVGRPAFYIGEPCIIARWGFQEWRDFLPVIRAFWLHELLDYYQKHGVEAWRICRCRRKLLRVSGLAALTLLSNRNLPRCNLFSFRRYVIRFWHYYDFWLGLLAVPAYHGIKSCIMQVFK